MGNFTNDKTQNKSHNYFEALRTENCELKRTNKCLKELLQKYKEMNRQQKCALKAAASKIIDNCRYCYLEKGSAKCKNTKCEHAMYAYFIRSTATDKKNFNN